MERYFLIAYTTQKKNGNFYITNTEGKHPSRKYLLEKIGDFTGGEHGVIHNIYEFKSKQDFKDFMSEE